MECFFDPDHLLVRMCHHVQFLVSKEPVAISFQGLPLAGEEHAYHAKQTPVIFVLIFLLVAGSFFIKVDFLPFAIVTAVAILAIVRFPVLRWISAINSSEYLQRLSTCVLQFLVFFLVCAGFLFVQYIAILFFGAFSDEVHGSDLRRGLFSIMWRQPAILLPIVTTILTFAFSLYKDLRTSDSFKSSPFSDWLWMPLRRIMIGHFSVLLGGFLAIVIFRFVHFEERILKAAMVGMLILIRDFADLRTLLKQDRKEFAHSPFS